MPILCIEWIFLVGAFLRLWGKPPSKTGELVCDNPWNDSTDTPCGRCEGCLGI